MKQYRLRENDGVWYVQEKNLWYWDDAKKYKSSQFGSFRRIDAYYNYEDAKARINALVESEHKSRIKNRYVNPPLPEEAPF